MKLVNVMKKMAAELDETFVKVETLVIDGNVTNAGTIELWQDGGLYSLMTYHTEDISGDIVILGNYVEDIEYTSKEM